jgi:phytoene/squalene synthetase
MSDEPQPSLPADVPPPLRAAIAAALAWLRELDREAESLRRPR